MGCIVRYTDESRIREVVATNDFDCEELQSRVRIGAMHHSKYGNAIYHSRTSPAKSNSWQRGTSTVRHHRDARIQVSLEQFMLQKPQTVKPPAEAESQSKPPSEEALPDSEPFDEGNSPPGVTNLGNNGKGKAIRVHLPATPKKEKHSSSQVIKKPTMGQENAAIAFKKSELLALAAPSETPLESCDCEDTGTSKTVRTSKSQEKALVNTSSEKSKVGKENPEQVDIFDLQPVQSTKSAKEAGHALDTLLDASIGLQSLKSDQQHVQPATDPESLSEKKYKGKGKSNKKKKKTAVVSEPPEATGSQNFDNHTTEGTAEEQGSQTQVVFILSRGRSMRVLEPENPQNPSPKNLTEYLGNGLKPSEANEPAETTSQDYRANAGGSLRMSKIRKKPLLELKLAGSSASDVDATLPSDTALASAASFVTAKEHSSCDGSQGMASTPATPFSGKETMPTAFTPEPPAADHVEASNTTILLNPQAKEFPSSGPSTMPLSSVKLAPIPLKRPMQHQRNVSDTSIATSRTITPDISPTKPDTDNAKKSVQGVTKRDTAIIPTDSNASTTPVSHDDKLTPENDDDDGLWQLQRNQRTLTKGKSKQPNGRMQSQQHHSYAKQGNSKNHHSPKKQKTQGKNHLLPRYVSSPNNRTASTSNKEDFPSVQAGRASDSVLPAASTWGKVRPASTATGATAISAKGHTTGGQVSNEEVDKQ
ncbi:uncharacterized protein CTRU02_207756 [Colletotrichum truncatum]|uniref:Uncharacterized protein n=1 Tax=Colletotrichum truncatum TaxID=5467 RepID=A0ACC3Z219_COLTU